MRSREEQEGVNLCAFEGKPEHETEVQLRLNSNPYRPGVENPP